MQRTIDLFENEKSYLVDYVDVIKKEVGPFGESVSDIFWKVEQYRNELGHNSVKIDISDHKETTGRELDHLANMLKDIGNIWEKLPDTVKMSWEGFTPTNILPDDESALYQVISQMAEICIKVFGKYENWINKWDVPLLQSPKELLALSQVDINVLNTTFSDIEKNIAHVFLNQVNSDKLQKAIAAIKNIEACSQVYEPIFTISDSSIDASNIREVLRSLIELGLGEISFDNIIKIASCLNNALNDHKAILTDIESFRQNHIQSVVPLMDYATTLNYILFISNTTDSCLRFAIPEHAKPTTNHIFNEARNHCLLLTEKYNKISKIVDVKLMPTAADLNDLATLFERHINRKMSFMSKDYRTAKKKLYFIQKSVNMSDKISLVKLLRNLADIKTKTEELSTQKDWSANLGNLYVGLETNWNDLNDCILWSQKLTSFTQSFEKTKSIFTSLDAHYEDASKITNRINEFVNNYAKNTIDLNISIENCFTDPELIHKVKDIKNKVDKALSVLSKYKISEPLTISDLFDSIEALQKAKMIHDSVDFKKTYADLFQPLWSGLDTDIELLGKICLWVKDLNSKSKLPNNLVYWLLQKDSVDNNLEILKDMCTEASWFSSQMSSLIAKTKQYGELSANDWFNVKNNTYDKFIEKLNTCLRTITYLQELGSYYRLVDKIKNTKFGELIDILESGAIKPKKLPTCMLYSYYYAFSKSLISEHPILANFTLTRHENNIARFKELDHKLKKLHCKYLAYKISKNRHIPRGNKVGRVRDYTELSLIKHEVNKKRRHIPIRQLVKRSSQALQGLKPCFMMSPLSISQYLSPGMINFDLVVMDEASQIKPEDSLGAILRTNQLVVVGDSNQLPPTSFFNKVDLFEDEDAVAADEAESVLEVCANHFTSRRLMWHYRSLHESLIAFSNYNFYDNKLRIFPSPYSKTEGYGIKYHYCTNAKYNSGINEIEALRLVDSVINHLKYNSSETLGVATFNRDQKDLIDSLLDDLQRKDASLDKAIAAYDKSEPFFVKNLENVQGDERDVIFVSTTYGPDKSSNKVHQRFGPINSDTGWRRLNVIFTRARKRLEVFTSLKSSDIVGGSQSKRGVITLKNYLKYIETGKLIEDSEFTDKTPDSAFEVAVSKIINDYGFKTTPQVGVAGFYIDIGVHHPDRDGEFILGVECDGAYYHSSKSARDRDRLRQEVLEAKGWTLHRVWSTDWFRRRDNEIARLVNAISESLTQYDKSRPISQVIESTSTQFQQEIKDSEITFSESIINQNTTSNGAASGKCEIIEDNHHESLSKNPIDTKTNNNTYIEYGNNIEHLAGVNRDAGFEVDISDSTVEIEDDYVSCIVRAIEDDMVAIDHNGSIETIERDDLANYDGTLDFEVGNTIEVPQYLLKEGSDYVIIYKNKSSAKYFIYISEASGDLVKLITPTGSVKLLNRDLFDEIGEMDINGLEANDQITKEQSLKYRNLNY